MDTTPFVEAVEKSGLPFVYSGDKLNDEKCQNLIKNASPEGTVLGVMTDFLDRGLVVTEKGIWFFPNYLIAVKGSKSNGAFPFDSFILHDVAVSSESIIEFTMWDKGKSKIFTVKFTLLQDTTFKDSMKESMSGATGAMNKELEDIFKTLTSKTGTEYVQKTEAEKVPNVFDFDCDNIHTRIDIEGNSVVINKFKVDEKTTIQTPKGKPITIPRTAIESIRTGRAFAPLNLLRLMGSGIAALLLFWLIINFLVGFIVFLLFTVFGLLISFPTTLIIKRKDGQKFVTRFYGSGKGDPEYERFINAIF